MANPAVAEKLRQVDSYDCLSWRVKGLHALTILSLLLAACQRAGITPRAPGVTEAIPTPPAEVIPVPVEIPPTAVVAPATSTEVLTGAGGGRPPLCDPLLAPFIPGEEATQDPDGVWIDSQGNPIVGQAGRPVDVDGTLLGISQLAEAGTILTVKTAGSGDDYRWFVEPEDERGRPLWTGESDGDPFFDHPNYLPPGKQLVLNPLPDPDAGGEIRFGVSGGEVTAAVVRDGLAVKCFNPVTNEWFILDSGLASPETPRPEETPIPALATPRSGADSLGELLTELASDKRATPEPTATEKPTAAATAKPAEAQPTPGGNSEIPGSGPCIRVDIPPDFHDWANYDRYNFPKYMGDFDTSRGNADVCTTPVRHPEWEKPGLLVQVFGPQSGFPEIIPVEEFNARNYGDRMYQAYGYIFDKGERNHANTFTVSLKP